MPDNKTIGYRIAEFRKEKGIGQGDFAHKIGVSRQAVSRWENGKREPGSRIIEDICCAFNVDANYFYSDKAVDEIAATEDSKPPIVAEKSCRFNKKQRIFLIIGWSIVAVVLAIMVFIIVISVLPNSNPTTVSAYAFSEIHIIIIIAAAFLVFVAGMITATILFKRKNSSKK